MFRRPFSAPALMAVAALGFTACGTDDNLSPSPSADLSADDAALATVDWTEASDRTPLLAFDFPPSVGGTVARVIEDGDGETIGPDQIVVIDYVVFSGVDGSVVYSTYENGFSDNVMFTEATVDPSMWDVLNGTQVGVRFVFAEPDVDSSVVAAMTVLSVSKVYERAEGDVVIPPEGLPRVTLAENGMPNIDFAGAEMPDDLVVQPLIVGVGAGAPVEKGRTLVVHYKGWIWDGEIFDCSWARGTPASFGFQDGYLIDGWMVGLEGQSVGSQVLLIIPPELGYGDVDQGTIPAGSTLVFVVDILAAF